MPVVVLPALALALVLVLMAAVQGTTAGSLIVALWLAALLCAASRHITTATSLE